MKIINAVCSSFVNIPFFMAAVDDSKAEVPCVLAIGKLYIFRAFPVDEILAVGAKGEAIAEFRIQGKPICSFKVHCEFD